MPKKRQFRYAGMRIEAVQQAKNKRRWKSCA